MSVSSTVFGYHVQYLYTLYRMIESADSKEVFVPEGREDLDIYLNDQIIETIQVKCYSGTIVYSDLFSKGKSTSLFSRGKDSLGGFCIIPWIKMLNYTSISTKLS